MTDTSSNAVPGPEPAFTFGELRLEPDGSLFRADEAIHLPPRELAALRILLKQAGRIVTPAQLKEALWGDVHVTPDSLLRCISSLRARLGPEDWIETFYKRGYRISAAVRRIDRRTAHELPRLALVPFACGVNVPAHLGQSLAEETTALLTARGAGMFNVLARDSVFTLASRGLTAQQIGESLRADFVLAGTLRCLPLHLRLRAEMGRVVEGTQIWVEDLLVHRDKINRIPLELLLRVAHRLQGEVPANIIGELRSPAAPQPGDCEEYPLDMPCGPPRPNAGEIQE